MEDGVRCVSRGRNYGKHGMDRPERGPNVVSSPGKLGTPLEVPRMPRSGPFAGRIAHLFVRIEPRRDDYRAHESTRVASAHTVALRLGASESGRLRV